MSLAFIQSVHGWPAAAGCCAVLAQLSMKRQKSTGWDDASWLITRARPAAAAAVSSAGGQQQQQSRAHNVITMTLSVISSSGDSSSNVGIGAARLQVIKLYM
jgi:hypothetical protein